MTWAGREYWEVRKLDCKIGTFRYYQAEFRLETNRLLHTSGTWGLGDQCDGIIRREGLVDTILYIEILTRHFFLIIEFSRGEVSTSRRQADDRPNYVQQTKIRSWRATLHWNQDQILITRLYPTWLLTEIDIHLCLLKTFNLTWIIHRNPRVNIWTDQYDVNTNTIFKSSAIFKTTLKKPFTLQFLKIIIFVRSWVKHQTKTITKTLFFFVWFRNSIFGENLLANLDIS